MTIKAQDDSPQETYLILEPNLSDDVHPYADQGLHAYGLVGDIYARDSEEAAVRYCQRTGRYGPIYVLPLSMFHRIPIRMAVG